MKDKRKPLINLLWVKDGTEATTPTNGTLQADR
jgi:hypothetical protein